jgi:hypothetical protein
MICSLRKRFIVECRNLTTIHHLYRYRHCSLSTVHCTNDLFAPQKDYCWIVEIKHPFTICIDTGTVHSALFTQHCSLSTVHCTNDLFAPQKDYCWIVEIKHPFIICIDTGTVHSALFTAPMICLLR